MQIHPANAQGLIRAFARHTFLVSPMVVFADSKALIRISGSQPDLGIRCPHIFEDTFSHGAIYLMKTKPFNVQNRMAL